MAKIVGEKGTVIAIDVQSEMLQCAKKKSDRHGLSSRILYHQNSLDSMGIEKNADFILSFHMVHEPGGKYLVAEPVFHVSEPAFNQTLDAAVRAGFRIEERPKISMSRAVLLTKS